MVLLKFSRLVVISRLFRDVLEGEFHIFFSIFLIQQLVVESIDIPIKEQINTEKYLQTFSIFSSLSSSWTYPHKYVKYELNVLSLFKTTAFTIVFNASVVICPLIPISKQVCACYVFYLQAFRYDKVTFLAFSICLKNGDSAFSVFRHILRYENIFEIFR